MSYLTQSVDPVTLLELAGLFIFCHVYSVSALASEGESSRRIYLKQFGVAGLTWFFLLSVAATMLYEGDFQPLKQSVYLLAIGDLLLLFVVGLTATTYTMYVAHSHKGG